MKKNMVSGRSLLILLILMIFFTIPQAFGQEDFSGFGFMDDESALSWNGEGTLSTRYTPDFNDLTLTDVSLYPELSLGLDYSGSSSEFHGEITFTQNIDFTNPEDISRYLKQLIDEAYFRVYLKGMDIEAGFMKIVWGKGDEIYTFDNLNAVDYSDFMNGDYLDRKIAEGMIKANIPFGTQGLVELVYTPVFTPDVIPQSGPWAPAEAAEMDAFINAELATYVGNRIPVLMAGDTALSPTAAQFIAQAEAAELGENALSVENTNTLAHGQAGFRITNSITGIDLGLSYQYSFLREPVADLTHFSTDYKIDISYDRVHLFGLEMAAVLAGFNIRGEAAYYLTADTAGDDPLVHNNRIEYLLGFDRNIPLSNLNLFVQGRGRAKLNTSGIGAGDIEESSSGTYTFHLIAGGLRDTYLNERMTLTLAGGYSIEGEDYFFMPEIELNIIDDAWVSLRYLLFGGDPDTLFGQYDDNDLFELVFRYSF